MRARSSASRAWACRPSSASTGPSISSSATGAVYGVVLILFAFFVPFGLVGLLRAALAPLVDRLPGRRAG